MHVQRVGFPGKTWLGLIAGLGVGLVLSVLGICLGVSFQAPAQESPAAADRAGGPLVVVTLQQGGTVKGALLESRNGKVRLQVKGEASERVYSIAEVSELDFALKEPVVAQADPTPKPVQPVAGPRVDPTPVGPQPEPKQKAEPKREPKNPVDWPKPPLPDKPDVEPRDKPNRPIFDPLWRRRNYVEDRRKRILEFLKQRGDERLTPDERKRMHDLIPREKDLKPTERQELERIRNKMGLLEPELFRRITSEVMDEAKQAQKEGQLVTYVNEHMKRLGYAMTTEERRRHIASVFAATHVGGRDVPIMLRETAINLMRSTKEAPAGLDARIKELGLMYDFFQAQIERGNAPGPRPRGL